MGRRRSPGGISKLCSTLSAWLGRICLVNRRTSVQALLSQFIFSLASVVMLLGLRSVMSPLDFGLLVLEITVSTFIGTVLAGYFAGPHFVRTDLQGQRLRKSTETGQGLAILLIGTSISIVTWHWLGWSATLIPAAGAFIALRWIKQLDGQVGLCLRADILAFSIQAVITVVCVASGSRLGLLLANSFGMAAGSVYLMWDSRASVRPNIADLRSWLVQSANSSFTSGLEFMVSYALFPVFLYVTKSTFGVAAVGDVRVLQVALGPLAAAVGAILPVVTGQHRAKLERGDSLSTSSIETAAIALFGLGIAIGMLIAVFLPNDTLTDPGLEALPSFLGAASIFILGGSSTSVLLTALRIRGHLRALLTFRTLQVLSLIPAILIPGYTTVITLVLLHSLGWFLAAYRGLSSRRTGLTA
jgi:hypothetical protein